MTSTALKKCVPGKVLDGVCVGKLCCSEEDGKQTETSAAAACKQAASVTVWCVFGAINANKSKSWGSVWEEHGLDKHSSHSVCRWAEVQTLNSSWNFFVVAGAEKAAGNKNTRQTRCASCCRIRSVTRDLWPRSWSERFNVLRCLGLFLFLLFFSHFHHYYFNNFTLF